MNHIRIVSSLLLISLLSVSAQAHRNKTVVKDVPSYQAGIRQSCGGQQIGARCEVVFTGGRVELGVCIQVPNSPVGAELMCQLNIPELQNCKNNALGTPSSWITLGSLAGFLLFLRRRRSKA